MKLNAYVNIDCISAGRYTKRMKEDKKIHSLQLSQVLSTQLWFWKEKEEKSLWFNNTKLSLDFFSFVRTALRDL